MTTSPHYEFGIDSQTVSVLTGFVGLMLQASDLIEEFLGKPLEFHDEGYTDEVIGIYAMADADSPDMALTVTSYIANPNLGPGITQYAVQVRARSANRDYRPAAFMLDAFRDHDRGPRLNGLSHVKLGEYHASGIMSSSLGDMGLDPKDRYEMTENYYIILNDQPGVEDPSPRYP